MKNKICLISSSGGHFAQLKQLKKIFTKNSYFIVTEKNHTTINEENVKYYLKQQDRKNIYFVNQLLYNIILAIRIIVIERPKVIISTGAGAVLPLCLLGKICGIKIIFIESFAKINTPTITGKIVYKFADRFYIQWEEMQRFYPNGIYKGTIY